MNVEVIYCQPDGTQTALGIRKLSHMPPVGEPFQLDEKQYVAKSFAGPDADGHYRLFLEDEEGATRH